MPKKFCDEEPRSVRLEYQSHGKSEFHDVRRIMGQEAISDPLQ